MPDPIVVVGAGHAAGQLLASLKPSGEKVVLFGDEPSLPYQRPPLSKKYLAGDFPAERLLVKPPAFFDDAQFDVHLKTAVQSIDRAGKQVTDANGNRHSYSSLVLATGSSVRPLTVEGSELPGVHYLRSIADVDGIRADLHAGARAVIIGAGYIGLEVAAVLRELGHEVTVVEMTERVMSRVVAPPVSDFFHAVHTGRSVEFRMETGVRRMTGDGRVEAVELSTGEVLPADFVVVGIGILPNTGLAESAGLEVSDGIVVDESCRTSDPSIYAIGDCTTHPNAIYGTTLRLESVHNALEQAKTAAANILGGSASYSEVPWFWSDQYEFKLQIAGLSQGYDDSVLRGDPDGGSFSCVYLKNGRVVAIDCVNRPRDFMQSKPLIAAQLSPPRDQLEDADLTLKEIGEALSGSP